MHDLHVLINIAVALVTAFIGAQSARGLGLPTLVGYMLAGMTISPFTPSFVGDVEDTSQLAELGAIFLMFGVGLHFPLRDLWALRGRYSSRAAASRRCPTPNPIRVSKRMICSA